jgi:hypothetical protein
LQRRTTPVGEPVDLLAILDAVGDQSSVSAAPAGGRSFRLKAHTSHEPVFEQPDQVISAAEPRRAA